MHRRAAVWFLPVSCCFGFCMLSRCLRDLYSCANACEWQRLHFLDGLVDDPSEVSMYRGKRMDMDTISIQQRNRYSWQMMPLFCFSLDGVLWSSQPGASE